jgi:hypothetical protein
MTRPSLLLDAALAERCRDGGQRRLWDVQSLPAFELGDIVPGEFTPELPQRSKSLSLIDYISRGLDRMQRV